MDVNGRMLLAMLLTALLSVFGLGASRSGPASHAPRLDRAPATEAPGSRALELSRSSGRTPATQGSPLQEFAEYDSEETDEEPGYPPASPSVAPRHAAGLDPSWYRRDPSGRPIRRGFSRLFLVCRHLVC